MDRFLEFAAGVFACGTDEISMDTGYQDYPKWDSLMMMRLVMETERKYGVNIPIETIGEIKTLADLYRCIQ